MKALGRYKMKIQSKRYRATLFLTILILLFAGCTRSTQTSLATPTLIPTGIFISPFPRVENPMAMIEFFAKETAYAQTAIAQGTPQSAFRTPVNNPMAMIEEFAKQTATMQTAIVQTKQAQYAGTSVAQGTATASVATVTPQPTITPQPILPTKTVSEILLNEAKKLPIPQIDWYGLPVAGPILLNIKSLGGDGLVGAFVTFVLGLFLANLKRLVKGIYNIGHFIWKIILKQNKHYVFEQMYLDWMIGQYRHLGMLPAQVAARRWGERQQLVDLEQIYTRLSLSNLGDDEAWNTKFNLKTRWGKTLHPVLKSLKSLIRIIFTLVLNLYELLASLLRRIPNTNLPAADFTFKGLDRLFPEPQYIPGSLSLIIDRTPRLVIKGDPGSGKTTLMRYLAITCARTLRNDNKEGDSNRMVFERLGWGITPYPIFVRLNRHGDVAKWGDQKSLMDAFKDEMPVDLRRRCPDGFFERLLGRRPCLILLDAFDELGSAQARSSMSEYINGFLEINGKEKHRFVVTTRVIGYEGQLDRIGFQSRNVQPLEQEERKSLISQRYKAFAFVEKLGRAPSEARSIEENLQHRERALIERIKSMPRLAQLATNPMLLSLITLVHFLKVELPDERVLLYRDCVEILTERWQRYKREETGLGAYPLQDLTLAQKTLLLQELAFAMQQRRNADSSQALLPKKAVIAIIADMLGRLSGDSTQKEELSRRAEEWVLGIQTDSGIILEQGLDQDGDPLIGFSHLTFQEYLSAVAISETPNYLGELMKNLLNPTWREVIRLYIVMADDATPLIKALCANHDQPDGAIVAGWCLTERVKKISAKAIQIVRKNLIGAFMTSDQYLSDIGEIMEKTITVLNIVPFLFEQAASSNLEKQITAIHALRGIHPSDAQLQEIKTLLVTITESSPSINVRVAAQETLSRIGDPRFESCAPIMVKIPAYLLRGIKPDVFDLPCNSNLPNRLFLSRILAYINAFIFSAGGINKLETRFFAQKIYIAWREIALGLKTYTDEFEVGRFPVTNFEYSRFINETDELAPVWWGSSACPIEKALHPVTGITLKNANKYCQWLNDKLGENYYLPSEWEWETAAGLLTGSLYPWGQEFNSNKCNSQENGLNSTTPVGIYHDIKSIHGVQDSSGNVGEYVRPLTRMYLGWLSVLFFTSAVVIYLIFKNIVATILLSFYFSIFASFPIFNELLQPLSQSGTIKGGSFTDKGENVSSQSRDSTVIKQINKSISSGFRVAHSINKTIEAKLDLKSK